MTLPRLLLRLIRSDLAGVATLAALLAVTAFLAAAAPLAVLRMDDDALRATLRDLPPRERGVTANLLSVVPAPGPVFSTDILGTDPAVPDQVRGYLSERLGPTLSRTVTARSYFAHLRPALPVKSIQDRGFELAFALRVQSDYQSQVRFVAGRPPAAPAASPAAAPSTGPSAEPGAEPAPAVPALLEVAISARSAQVARLRAGQALVLGPSSRAPAVTVRIAGVYEPLDPARPEWLAEPSLTVPTMRTDGTAPPPDPTDFWQVSLLTAPGALPSLFALDRTLYENPEGRMAWQFWPDLGRLHAGQVVAVQRELSGFAATAPNELNVATDTALPGVLAGFRRQQATTHAVISLAASGLFLVAVAVLVLAARLTLERRRGGLDLLRARGGSLAQLAALFAVETGLVAGAAGLAGFAVAALLLPGRGLGAAAGLVVAVVALVIVLVPALVLREQRAVGRTTRRDVVRHRPSLPRLAAEVLVVVLAALAVLELRRRGLSESAADGVDPLLVSVPVLVGLAVALLALRLYPVPLRWLGNLAARRRSAVPFLGLARAARESPVSVLPLVVLMATLSLGVFAGTLRGTVQHGQQVAAWENTQADARVGGVVDVPLPAATVRTLERARGVEVAATGFTDDSVSLRAGRDIVTVRAVAPDVPGYTALLRGSPSGYRFPAELSTPVGRGAEVPALVSPALAERVSGTTTLWLREGALRVRVAGSTAGMPGGGFDNQVVLPLDALRRSTGKPFPPSVVWLGGAGIQPAELRAAVAGLTPVPAVAVRTEAQAAVRDQPLVRGALLAFAAAAVLGAGYGLFAVRLALLVTARPRERMLSYLRALGLSPGQARGLAVLEFVPLVALAAVLGTVVGLLLPYLVGPALGLGPFTGGARDPAVHIDPLTVAAVTGGLVAVVAAALVAETVLGGRRQLAGVLRTAEEE